MQGKKNIVIGYQLSVVSFMIIKENQSQGSVKVQKSKNVKVAAGC